MKRKFTFCAVGFALVATLLLQAAPTPTPAGPSIKVPGKKVTPAPKPSPIHIPGKHGPTTTPTVAPIKIPGKNDPTPTATVASIKVPGKNTGTPTPKILIPGKKIAPPPAPPAKEDKKKDVHASENNPLALSNLGDEAFLVKKGRDNEIYIRKKSWILEVDGSGDSEKLKALAVLAAARLP